MLLHLVLCYYIMKIILYYLVLSLNSMLISAHLGCTFHLAGIIVRNILVTYDRQNRRIGFWKTNCSHLWEALHMDVTPSSMPSASHDKNYTGENSSAASSSAPQSYNLPGPV